MALHQHALEASFSAASCWVISQSVFAPVTDDAAETTAKALIVYTRQALLSVLDDVQMFASCQAVSVAVQDGH